MKRALFALAALVLVLPALAAGPTATLSWSPPTAFTDATPIPAGTAITYNVYQGGSATTLTKVASNVTATTDTISTGLADGQTYFWSVTAVVAGVESAQAAPVSKTFPAGTPGNVINLKVTWLDAGLSPFG